MVRFDVGELYDEHGQLKNIHEMSLTARQMITQLDTFEQHDNKVTNIRVANYSEVHNVENSNAWFKSKVTLFAFYEETGKERKTNLFLLVQGNDVESAYINTINAMKNTMGEYSIPSVSETAIVDVFPYVSGEVE